MAEHMDLYTDCPDCDGKGYYIRQMYNEPEPYGMQCETCHNTVHHYNIHPTWDVEYPRQEGAG